MWLLFSWGRVGKTFKQGGGWGVGYQGENYKSELEEIF